MKGITIKQDIVLEAVKYFIKENGFSPTITELKGILDYSSANSVVNFLTALERKGYIKRTPNKARSIVILQA
tara:strand:+ start:182 stop:397 length:216 start_codon:yes stop_codon:yes gene_type:complete